MIRIMSRVHMYEQPLSTASRLTDNLPLYFVNICQPASQRVSQRVSQPANQPASAHNATLIIHY
ncbi:hypothetical protein K504DRAFT_40796 [Pleomassaria siparia CBS 279.74]|uniref:Uncharacterized protein n=1 Tax=Pleomassaria siparia CBS 279.74 TaxID=1314801 RepID=A0A6G1K4Y1_9PLEO|nr:hypothetical protein K504DRAFT_40796 [Pleomassaria siparia CBS 279.74]